MSKKQIFSSLLILTVILSSSYSGNKSKEQTQADKKFGKLEVEIPASLQNKPEVAAYIQNMAVLSDEYALLVDKAVVDTKEFKGKTEDELGMMDKIKLTKIASEVGFKTIEILGKWGECTEKRFEMEKGLTIDEIQALDAVMKRFEERMKQVKARHADVFKDNEKE